MDGKENRPVSGLDKLVHTFREKNQRLIQTLERQERERESHIVSVFNRKKLSQKNMQPVDNQLPEEKELQNSCGLRVVKVPAHKLVPLSL